MPAYDPITIYDRPRLALENLLAGDTSGALTSLSSPEELSPHQRGWVETDGGWKPKGNGFYDALLRTVTNPIVMVAAVVAWKWPVKKLAEVAGFVRQANTASRKLPRLVLGIQDYGTMFRGMPIKGVADEALDSIKTIRETGVNTISDGLLKWEAKVGRSVTMQDQIRAQMELDGLTRPGKSIWRIMATSDDVGRRALYLQKHGDLARANPAAFGRLATSKGDPEIEALIRRLSDKEAPAGAVKSSFQAPKELVDSGVELREKIWDMAVSDPEVAARLADKNQRVAQGMLRQMHEHGIEVPKELRAALKGGDLKKVKEYAPHIMLGNDFQFHQYAEAVARQTEAEAATLGLRGAEKSSKRLWQRQGGMIPSTQDLMMVADDLSPDHRRLVEAISGATEKFGGNPLWVKPKEYSLRYGAVWENYSHSMAQAITWTGKGYGPRMIQEMEHLQLTDPARFHYMKETFLPIMQNRLDPREAEYALEWGHYKYAAYQMFDKPAVQKIIGKERSEWFKKQLTKPGFQNLTYKQAGAKIASYLYTSTLAGNPVSPMLNLMQPTMGLAGIAPKYMAEGGFSAAKIAAEFIEEAAKLNSIDKAWMKMAEKYPAVRAVHDSAESEVMEVLRRAKSGGTTGSNIRIKAQRVAMSLFSGSERWNKLMAYETGRIGALKEGADAAMSLRIGEEIMRMTQFGGGWQGTPAHLVKTWAPWRQFVQFPARTLGLAMSDPGVAARMTLAGVGIYEAGRLLNLDLSRGTLVGALPAPYSEDQPFYPFPVIPPAIGLVGAAASDVFTGQLDQLRRSAPLLVPGGVGLSRAASALFPEAAKALGRPYADYQNLRPDGTYPMYSSEGNLIGFKRPVDLFADAVGWTSLTGNNVADLEQFLVKNRDKIREVRRQYIESIAKNDIEGANKLNAQYKKMFPGLGDLVVKKQDIEAIHLRHDVSRIERILQTFPAELRSQYGTAVGIGLMEGGEEFLGVDPALLSAGTARTRNPQRVVPTGSQTTTLGQAVGGNQGSVLGNRLRLDQTGNQPRRSPFGNFDGFGEY